MSMTSDEVNFLVYRYLQESGFQHSAFTFGIESHIDQSNINGSVVPPGALVSVLQKGVQYVESEATLTEDGAVLDDSELDQLSLIDAVIPDIISLRHSQAGSKIIKSDIALKNDSIGEDIYHMNSVSSENVDLNGVSTDGNNHKALILKGHESEVFVCSWHPLQDILVSGSEDGTARLWFINENGAGTPTILEHKPKEQQDISTLSFDISTLEWNSDGTYLASGCFDGCIRIWSQEGHLVATLQEHKAPVFALKWNKKGNFLVSAGVDKTSFVWETSTWEVKQQFACHQDPTLDIDWQNSNTFASCSADKSIHICKIGQDKPVKTFRGHTGDINTIRWDPSGSFLASGSVDTSVKIWSLKQDTCVQDLQGHKKEIYAITWCPTNGTTNSPLLLASASCDTTVRLWDVEKGTCLYTLSNHFKSVTSLSFSPDGKYLVSGSFDKHVYIWSTQMGNLVHTYQGNGAVHDVKWNSKGDKLAACFASALVCVLDLSSLS